MIIEIYDKPDEVIQETFASLLSINQTGIEELIKGFAINDICHKWHLKCGEWYIDSNLIW